MSRYWCLTVIVMLSSLSMLAQKDKKESDEVVYYTDSDVRGSKLGLAANVNPVYADMRIINDELVGLGGSGFEPTTADADGTFQVNYHLELIYSLNENFGVSVGFGRSSGGFTYRDGVYIPSEVQPDDSIKVTNRVEAGMYSIPVKIHFSTSMSDVFDLEVVPSVGINFIDRYTEQLIVQEGPDEDFDPESFVDYTQDMNWTVGISVGGTYWLSDNWGYFLRPTVNYMLNEMVQLEGFPRETLIYYGVNTGFRYKF